MDVLSTCSSAFRGLPAALIQLAALPGIVFLPGKGKRKTPLQRDMEILVAYGDKRHNGMKIQNLVADDELDLHAFRQNAPDKME